MTLRKICVLIIAIFTCFCMDAQKSSGGKQRRSTSTTRVQKKKAKKTTAQDKTQPTSVEEAEPQPEEDYSEILAQQIPTVNIVLQAKKDPESKKYGYENVGEKQYWWAEAHKLGNKKEELNTDQRIQWVISPQYDKVSKHFSEGLAAVEIDGKVGFIDQFNRFIIKPEFEPMDDMDSFHNGLATVKKDGKYGFINKRGEFIIPPRFDKAENFGDDMLAVVKQNGKFGCIDLHGDTVLPCTYLAKEVMTMIPIKNKPYKNAQKTIRTKIDNGDYDDLQKKILSSEEHAFSLLENLKYMPVSGQQPNVAKGNLKDLSDGFYLWQNGDRQGIIDSYGRVVIQPNYKCVAYQPNEKIFIVEDKSRHDGKPAFGIINRAGGWIIPPVFETMDSFKKGVAKATVGDHSTNVDVNGLVEASFIEKMLKASSEEKGTFYTQRLIGIWPTCAPAHNNIGIYYASSCDDLKHAINHFTVAHRLDPDNEDFKANMKAAKSERNNRRWNRVLTGLQIAATVLTIGAMTYSAVSGNTVMPSSDFSTVGVASYDGGGSDYSSGAGSSGSTGGLSESTYRNQYSRWERNAKSCYESLTLLGTRVQKNGKDSSGSANGSWGAGSYVGMKKNLRNAQREMQKVRREAQRHGISIPQSEYETVTVSY